MNRRVIALYDEYTPGSMGRREFLPRLARSAGGTAAAAALLPLLENRYAHAATVAPDDP
jgi:carboxymethylenebutenolidase